MSNTSTIEYAAEVFIQGGILAYPTEAVFGLGCDPDNNDAVKKLLLLKKRSSDKGLILLASNYIQLLPYLDNSAMSEGERNRILSRWPDALTQILPATKNISKLLCGIYDSIAVRITNHPDVITLCNLTGKPIVSTSANLAGEPPATTWQQVEQQLGDKIDHIIKTETLGYLKPTSIINGLTGEVIR
jgi:L-threonylcarbamoyladenylate synthase